MKKKLISKNNPDPEKRLKIIEVKSYEEVWKEIIATKNQQIKKAKVI